MDDQNPDLEHIWARHLKTIDDVAEIFFNGVTVWNAFNQCNETTLGNEVLRWIYLGSDEKKVLIITCFNK